MHNRSLFRSFILVVLAAALAASVAIAASASAQDDTQTEEDDWRPCQELQTIERAEIVLVMDRSGSLGDETAKLRNALQSVRSQLTSLQTDLSDSVSVDTFEIDVALIAFEGEAKEVTGFASASSNHPSNDQIAAATNAQRGFTNYGPAINVATQLFEGSSNAKSTGTCRIIILFTDGVMRLSNGPAGSQEESDLLKVLEDTCRNNGYRDRLDTLDVSTYVAVAKDPGFDNDDIRARASRQAILALTGHADAPLLGDGQDPSEGCEELSENRVGKIVDFEGIGNLTIELGKVVEDIEAALSRTTCQSGERVTAKFVDDEWPDQLVARDTSAARRLCTIQAPGDGTTTVSLSGNGPAADIEWLIDDGRTQAAIRKLRAGDDPLAFNIIATDLPFSDPFGGFDAKVEVIVEWESGSAEPEPQTISVEFPVPSRERHWIDRLVPCIEFERATKVEIDTGVEEEHARSSCEIQAPPTGQFELSLEAADPGNRLGWSLARSSDADAALEREDLVVIDSDDSNVQLGVVATRTNTSDIFRFEDKVTIELLWRSSRGTLYQKPFEPIIRVGSRPTTELDCASTAEATDAIMGDGEEDELVVDTGCKLLPPPQTGAVSVQVVGDLDGRQWELVKWDGSDWEEQEEVTVGERDEGKRLFVRIKHTELDRMVDSISQFTLVTVWDGGLNDPRAEGQTTRSVGIYLPLLACPDRFDAPSPALTTDGPVATAISACSIEAPPNGNLKVSSDADLQWWSSSSEDPQQVSSIPAGGGDIDLSAVSDPLRPEQLPANTPVTVDVTWISELGYESNHSTSFSLEIPNIESPLDCSGTPEFVTSGDVPDGPVIIDTGCVLSPPDAGTFDISDIEGGIIIPGLDDDGVSWECHSGCEIGSGDEPSPIIIETDDPLPNGNYELDGDFDLAATWTPSDNGPTYQTDPGQPGGQSRDVAVELRARPDTSSAALIFAALILAGLGVVWFILRTVGRRSNRLRKPGAYRVVHQEVTAIADPSGRLELLNFDAATAAAQSGDRLDKSGSRLQAAGLTIRTTARWWNPSDLLDGGRTTVVPQGSRELEIAVSPSSGEPDCLPNSPAHGTVIAAIERTSKSSDDGRSQHRGLIWILMDTKAKASVKQTADRTVQQNISKALNNLRRDLKGRSSAGAPAQQKG